MPLVSAKDMTSHVLAFKDVDVDGVIMWSDDQPAGLLTKQMKTLGVRFGLAGSAGLAQPSFIRLAGDAAEGVFAIVAWSAENPAPEVQAYKAKYQAAYGDPPELFASTYYDAAHLAARAMRAAPEITGPAIREALTKTQDVPGVLARYNWTTTGDLIQSGLITRVENGKPTVVKVVNLRRLAASLAFSLSGGEQQMLAIGRALMSKPSLLMLDEPSLGLAPLLVDQVFEKLREINRRGSAILLVEQNGRMALAMAHRAYVLGSGRVVLEGPAATLMQDDQIRQAYLGGSHDQAA